MMFRFNVEFTATKLMALFILIAGVGAGLIMDDPVIITTTIITSPALLAIRSIVNKKQS